ncbi:hypothetical protein M758_12G009000 [Ceratodon purpureus]|nr:hypothetical protein M758_12G009000 [Ceratodon purpureus]
MVAWQIQGQTANFLASAVDSHVTWLVGCRGIGILFAALSTIFPGTGSGATCCQSVGLNNMATHMVWGLYVLRGRHSFQLPLCETIQLMSLYTAKAEREEVSRRVRDASKFFF